MLQWSLFLNLLFGNLLMHHTSSNQPNNLWYKNYMVLVFVIGLPALVVIVCLFFIYYSIKIQDSTVRDDWYMDGKALYQDASRDQMTYDLGISGVMRFEQQDDKTRLRFELNYPAENLTTHTLNDGTPLVYPKTLSAKISHATDISKDRDVALVHQSDNVYYGEVVMDQSPAKYYVQIENDGAHNWRLVQHETFPVNNISFHPLTSFDHTGNHLPDQRNKRADVSDKVE